MTIEYIPKDLGSIFDSSYPNRFIHREASVTCATCSIVLHPGEVITVPDAIQLARLHDAKHNNQHKIIVSETACGYGL